MGATEKILIKNAEYDKKIEALKNRREHMRTVKKLRIVLDGIENGFC